ncbi:hypothetical protein GCM10028817_38870 [Spirosoma pomorum]
MFSTQITSAQLTPGYEFTSKWFKGIVSVIRTDETKDLLCVKITRESGGYHEEDWVLNHTLLGFKRGDYTPYQSVEQNV